MRIKKFRCINCGGPKVNPYRSPYIMCDFCGSFTDIDFTAGIDTWNESEARTSHYQLRKMEYMARLQMTLAAGDYPGYYLLQREYWDFYYRSFPAYLPPTIDSAEKYSVYLDVCAESAAESGFDPKWQQYLITQQRLQAAVQYVKLGAETRAESNSFFALADFFLRMTREGMRVFYESPRYTIMHELLPEAIHLKMKMSMFVQAWLPYLSERDAGKLLDMAGLSDEYVEMEPPAGRAVPCTTCKAEIFAPNGSYRVFCENCRHNVMVRNSFYCMSCGGRNDVPENPGRPAACSQCGTSNRLIEPLFG